MRNCILLVALCISLTNGQLCPIIWKHRFAECRPTCDNFGTVDETYGMMGCFGKKCCMPDADHIPTTSEPELTSETTTTVAPVYTGPTVDPTEQCGRGPAPTRRIIHGTKTKPCDWSWQVSIRSRISGTDPLNPQNTFPWCSGVIIDTQWVLTTAYCVMLSASTGNGDVMNNMLVVAGDYNTHQPDYRGSGYNENFIQVSKIQIHPDYYKPDYKTFTAYDLAESNEDKISNNMALLKLAKPLEFGDCIRKVCSPKMETCWSRKECKVAGWGNTDTDNVGVTSDELVAADIMMYSPSVCEAINSIHLNQTDPMKKLTTCAMAKNFSANVCLGDNGGMVVCKNNEGKWTLEGLINRPSHEKCSPGSLFNVSYVQPAMTWIKGVTGM